MLEIENTELYQADNILPVKTAAQLIQNLKASGKTVGLCHGGFDLLHPGYITLFESAKKLCDILFVSVTSDRFVSSRKGSGRPIFNDKLRAYGVANLRVVDYVVISDFEKGVEIIEQLKPSFYIKGPDFKDKNTPGINAERQKIKDVSGEIIYTEGPKLSDGSKLGAREIINYIKDNVDAKKILLCIDRDGTIIEDMNFLGKESDWKDKVKLKENIISLISFLQTKYRTRSLVISNQGGVARNYFNCERVEEINNYINELLLQRGIRIDDWQYCPYADAKFVESKKDEIQFNMNFVKETTRRKPSEAMVLDGLKKFGENITDFNKIIVFGDRDEDLELAKRLNALYINSNEEYEEAKRGIESEIN